MASMATLQQGNAAALLPAWAVAAVVVTASLLLQLVAVQSDGFGADGEPHPFVWPVPEGGPAPQLQQHAAPYDKDASSPPSYKKAIPSYLPLAPRRPAILHDGSGVAEPDRRLLKAVVVGHVLCRSCHERKPLPGAQVAVSCWSEDSEVGFFGTTDNDGLYHIELAGFNYEKYGGNACRALLVAAPPESSCAMPTGGAAMGPARLHIKSKSDAEVVLFSKTFTLEATVECQGGHPTHLPPPLVLPLHPYLYESPPPPHSGSLLPPHSPYHSYVHSPPSHSSHTPTPPPHQYPAPPHEYGPPYTPSHEHIMPPPPHAMDHLYAPPASHPTHAYPSPQNRTPPVYYMPPPELLTPPYKYESPPPPPSSGYPEYTHPPPQSAMRSPHDLAPPPIPHVYYSPPPTQLLPPYNYQPPPIALNVESPPQATPRAPTSGTPIPSFHKDTKSPPSTS